MKMENVECFRMEPVKTRLVRFDSVRRAQGRRSSNLSASDMDYVFV